MDTRERIKAARERLRELQLDERRAELAGAPCVDCRHVTQAMRGYPKEPVAVCGHLAYTKRHFDPTQGKFIEAAEVDAADARSEDGLCGPEAILFDSKWHLPKRAALAWKLAPVAVAGGLVGYWMLVLTGH